MDAWRPCARADACAPGGRAFLGEALHRYKRMGWWGAAREGSGGEVASNYRRIDEGRHHNSHRARGRAQRPRHAPGWNMQQDCRRQGEQRERGCRACRKSGGVACLRLAAHAPLEVLVLVDALNERPDIVRHLSRARRLSARQPRVSKSIGSDDRRCETRRRLRSATATTSRCRSAASWLQGPADAQSTGIRFGKSPALAKASENESVARRRVAVSLFAALLVVSENRGAGWVVRGTSSRRRWLPSRHANCLHQTPRHAASGIDLLLLLLLLVSLRSCYSCCRCRRGRRVGIAATLRITRTPRASAS